MKFSMSTSFRSGRAASVQLLFALLILARMPAPLSAQDSSSSDKEVLVDRLSALLEKRQGHSFWSTVNRLEALGKEAVPALRRKLESESERARLGCAKALLQIGDLKSRDAALKTLAELARSAEDRDVQIDAIQVYGLQGELEEALEVLGKVFDDTLDPKIQISLARTLWEIDHVPKARERLVDLLRSKDLEVRYEAALTLAEIDFFEGEVRTVLRSLKREPTPRGRRAALLDRIMRLSRELDSGLEKGDVLLEGTDPAKLLKLKEQRIRELEDAVERLADNPEAVKARPRTPADRLFEEVVGIIREFYVDAEKTLREKLVLSAVKGMVRSLDEHSMFMDPEETREFSQGLHGQYHGIGAQVSKQPGAPLEILSPIYGGPAFRKGIQSADKIIEIEGVRTDDLTMNEIMKLLKGPEGTRVNLKVWRRGWREYRDFEITRETIEVPSVYYESLPEGLGYIRLTQFGFNSTDEFIAALETLERQELQGLVIDLRSNPGGLLKAALKVTDLFVRGDLPIVTEKGRGKEGENEVSHYPTDEARTIYPIVVLINQHSASASEIVAGALQDYGRAMLVGKRTFGKGSVQQPLALKNMEGSQLKLTVRYYFLPLDRCIHSRRDEKGRIVEQGGVEPDITVDTEPLPTWRHEERIVLRNTSAILDYVDRHFAELALLIPLGDRGDLSRYPELDALLSQLETRAPEEDVRAVVRFQVERRLEDQRGRQFAFDLQDDRQLQVAVCGLLKLMGRDRATSEHYGWIPEFQAAEKKAASGKAEAGKDTGKEEEQEEQEEQDGEEDGKEEGKPEAGTGETQKDE